MNSYIERISLYSILIFILIVAHFETDNSKSIVYASSSFSEYNTENFSNNEERTITKSSEIDYVTNSSQSSVESNSVISTNNTMEEKETKKIIESTDITISNNTLAYNENYQTSINSKESGPNNNNQFEEQQTDLIKSNNTVSAEYAVSNTNTEQEAVIIDKVAEMSGQLAKPPPPGGGEDPFAVPIDDFYGLFLVLVGSIIFGVFRLRKLKSIC
jgi:hypothetical protein